MKKSLILASALSCLFGTASAEQEMQKLNKDALIMENILATSMKQNNRRKGIRFRSIETGYLAGQGILFEVRTSSSGGMRFEFNFDEMMDDFTVFAENFSQSIPPVPPRPPLPEASEAEAFSESHSFSFSFDDDEDYEDEMEDRAKEARREARERRREVREKQRELKWEAREYERAVRDIEFQLRHADEESRKELEKKEEKMRARMEELTKRENAYVKQEEELEAVERQRKAEAEERKMQQVKSFLVDFESVVADALCDYGNGLRSLPEGENVNFVLKDFVRGEGDKSRNRLDKVYVFEMKDIKRCVQQDISPNDLLVASKTYLF